MNNSKKPKVETQKSQLESEKTFEQQLIVSAHRLREKQDADLQINEPDASLQTYTLPQIVSPQHSAHRVYWGWIATPAAAAIGLLIGLFIHKPTTAPDQLTVPVVAVETSGQSILDDGANYALFVPM